MQLDVEMQTVQNNHVQSKRFMIIHDHLTKPYFSRMKRVIQHTRNCPRKKTGQQGPCSICKQVIKPILFTRFSLTEHFSLLLSAAIMLNVVKKRVVEYHIAL